VTCDDLDSTSRINLSLSAVASLTRSRRRATAP
jgi:hypothetical protein